MRFPRNPLKFHLFVARSLSLSRSLAHAQYVARELIRDADVAIVTRALFSTADLLTADAHVFHGTGASFRFGETLFRELTFRNRDVTVTSFVLSSVVIPTELSAAAFTAGAASPKARRENATRAKGWIQ